MEYAHNILRLCSRYGASGRAGGGDLDDNVNQFPRLLETSSAGPKETVVRDLAGTAEKGSDVLRNDIHRQFTRERE